MDREALAWAAGFYEGEGSICTLHKDRGPGGTAALMSVVQADRPLLERFRDVLGGVGGIYLQRTASPHAGRYGHKEMWGWQASKFESVQAVVAMLWPWLGDRRKADIKRVLTTVHGNLLVRRQQSICWRIFGKARRDFTPAEAVTYGRMMNANRRARDRGEPVPYPSDSFRSRPRPRTGILAPYSE